MVGQVAIQASELEEASGEQGAGVGTAKAIDQEILAQIEAKYKKGPDTD